MGSSLRSADRGKEDVGPDLQMILHNMQISPEMNSCSTIVPHWNIPEGQWLKESPSVVVPSRT